MKAEKITLFSDIDNTLLFSHRVIKEKNRIPAEYLNGKEQSFMTASVYDFLKENESRIDLIPVSTRTEEQYRRIFLFREKLHCPYAMICNGGVPLRDGMRDEEWFRESMRISEHERGEVLKAYELMGTMCASEKMHAPEPFFVYASVEDPAGSCLRLRERLDLQKVYVGHDRRKVYVIAASINKGKAVSRFRERFRVQRIVTAGDSEFDLPMSEYGRPAIVPKELIVQLHNSRAVALEHFETQFRGALASVMESS